MRIVLLGDIHVYRLRLRPWHLIGKRVLGQANLWLRRRHHFRRGLLTKVVRRAVELAPDYVLGSGDLTTTATRAEFEMAQSVLDPLLSKFPAFIVPGNHDRYTFTAARRKRFENYFAAQTAAAWPHVRRLGERLVLIGLDPTRPNIITDRGVIGVAQLERLRRAIEALDPADRAIVLCHYTLGVPPGRKPERARHALIDAAALIDALRGPRPVLFMHGHQHDPWRWTMPTAPNITTLNAGAPVLVTRDWPGGQGFWEIETDPASAAADWKIIHHAMNADHQWHALEWA